LERIDMDEEITNLPSETREVPLKDIKPGPIQHKKGLSPLLEKLSRDTFAKVGHFVYPTFEQWELGFMRDMHPWREILIWETIARTHDLYLAKHPDADMQQAVGTIILLSLGKVSENPTEAEEELRTLYGEARSKRWSALTEEPVDFPEGNAIVLQYEDVVDEWDGNIHPNLCRQLDPRQVLSQADIILGQDVKTEKLFFLFGTDRWQDGGLPAELKTLIVSLDTENEDQHDFERICAVVQVIKGYHDCG
jgi:hypothetical protein